MKSPHITNDDVQPFFTVRLLDMNNNIIESVPFCAKASLNDLILNNVGNQLFYTEGFYCHTLIIPEEYVNNQNIKVQFVIADCGLGGDVGMVYIDNIMQGKICSNPQYGFLDLNPVIEECNPKKVEVTGTYNEPQGAAYTSSVLSVLDSLGNLVPISPANVVLNSFSNGTFSYTIDLNSPLPIGGYEIKIEAVFTGSNGYQYNLEALSTNPGADIVFSDGSPLDVITIHNAPGQVSYPFMAKWDDVGGPYVIEYVSDGYCCKKASPIQNIDQVVYSIVSYNNYIDNDLWAIMVNTMSSKCLRFRVKGKCAKWSRWCCITSYSPGEGGYDPYDPSDYFNTCLEEIDLNNLNPYQLLTAYPNPTTGLVSVSNSHATVFELYDLNQKIVKKIQLVEPQEKVEINLLNFKPGIYILKTNKNQEVKIIKQ